LRQVRPTNKPFPTFIVGGTVWVSACAFSAGPTVGHGVGVGESVGVSVIVEVRETVGVIVGVMIAVGVEDGVMVEVEAAEGDALGTADEEGEAEALGEGEIEGEMEGEMEGEIEGEGDGVGVGTSSRIVTVTSVTPSVAFSGALREIVKFSFPSISSSGRTGTPIFMLRTPGGNVRVPEAGSKSWSAAAEPGAVA
jgi:hypothetical protein